DVDFWLPLGTAFDYRELASESKIKDTKDKLGKFCSKESINSDIAKSLDSYESQLRNIFFKQLIVKGDKDYIVNEQLINSLKLSDADKTTLITELTLAANQLNVNSASDQKYQAKLVDIQVQLNNVLPILKDNQAALLAFAPDEELDESKNDPRFVLAQSVQTMFTAHSEAMIHIATAVEYERKASESSAIDKIAKIGLDAKFIRPELTGDIALAKFLLAKRSANNIKLEQINSMLVPAHKEFQSSWEKELKRPQFVKSTATTLNDDFVQMGMGRAHIDQIVKQIDEYDFDFKTDDKDSSVFYTMIKDIVKSLIQYITQFSEGVKK
ncbi:MAG: hypothetical protein LW817_08080, partial [Candidatus Caenarcaniphilales bacterium]|nr:hypothetical protein [Candidatus Caenarcaniphilales bacterium]